MTSKWCSIWLWFVICYFWLVQNSLPKYPTKFLRLVQIRNSKDTKQKETCFFHQRRTIRNQSARSHLFFCVNIFVCEKNHLNTNNFWECGPQSTHRQKHVYQLPHLRPYQYVYTTYWMSVYKNIRFMIMWRLFLYIGLFEHLYACYFFIISSISIDIPQRVRTVR